MTIEAGILRQYTEITLTSAGESETYKFDAAGQVTNADYLPFRFAGTLKVYGESANDVLLKIDYATLDGNDCKAPEQYPFFHFKYGCDAAVPTRRMYSGFLGRCQRDLDRIQIPL